MPRVLRDNGYKFYIYLNESPFEPAHVHVLTSDMTGEMKVWLNESLDIEECYNIPRHKWREILKIIKQQKKLLQDKYYELNPTTPRK